MLNFVKFFQHIIKWSCCFCGFFFVCLFCGVFLICLFVFWDFRILNHSCIPGMKPSSLWWRIILMCLWIQFAKISFSIFTSIFIKEIGLKFSFFVESLCNFGISITVASYNILGSVPSVSTLWNNLKSICIMSSLRVW